MNQRRKGKKGLDLKVAAKIVSGNCYVDNDGVGWVGGLLGCTGWAVGRRLVTGLLGLGAYGVIQDWYLGREGRGVWWLGRRGVDVLVVAVACDVGAGGAGDEGNPG